MYHSIKDKRCLMSPGCVLMVADFRGFHCSSRMLRYTVNKSTKIYTIPTWKMFCHPDTFQADCTDCGRWCCCCRAAAVSNAKSLLLCFVSTGGHPPPALLHLPLRCPHHWCLCLKVSEMTHFCERILWGWNKEHSQEAYSRYISHKDLIHPNDDWECFKPVPDKMV